MQPDQQQHTTDGRADVEAGWPKTQALDQPSSVATHEVISTENHHFFGAHLNPRRQVYFDKAAHGYVIKHSRAHRKNRFTEFLPDEQHWEHLTIVPKWPQFLRFDYKNISWHVAIFFTLGSIAWIVNGQYAMWPVQGDAELQVNINGSGFSALVGGLLFWVGAYLSIVEALNEKQNMNFGIELRHVLDKLEDESRDVQLFIKNKHKNIEIKKQPADGSASNGQTGGNRGACHLKYIENPQKENSTTNGTTTSTGLKESSTTTRPWRWWGLETSSFGWWASVIQFTGATAFTTSVITGTPGVLASSQWQVTVALIWTMQVVGSIGFIISSGMLMLEEQRKWYLPALDRIGWHSAFWNLIGSFGFFFSAVFGYLANWGGNGEVCCQFWGTAFNTYYGSWAFLISSVLLLIEVENKEPTRFDHLVARAAAWVAIKTRCDSANLDEEEEYSKHQNGGGGDSGDTPVEMRDRKVCY